MCVFVRTERVCCVKSMTKRTEESENFDAPPVYDIANNAVMTVYDHILTLSTNNKYTSTLILL